MERDFQNSLLMPMPGPGQNLHEKEYRENPIPGGKESFGKEIKSEAGGYRQPDGGYTQFK